MIKPVKKQSLIIQGFILDEKFTAKIYNLRTLSIFTNRSYR
jgi:hypothetical protein